MINVNSININPISIKLTPGEWYYNVCVNVCPEDATCKSVTWHSDNTNVATVNETTGYIYANSIGTTRIYATAKDGSGATSCIIVTVCETILVDSVEITAKKIALEAGRTFTLDATVYPYNATNKDLLWESSDPNIAHLHGTMVCAIGPGTTVITATSTDGSEIYDKCIVTVTNDTLVTSISVEPFNNTIKVGDSLLLQETVCPSNATKKCVTWSSSNTDIATVNPETGLVYGKSVGTVSIYATAKDLSEKRGYCIVNVQPIIVEAITVTPQELNMYIGDTTTLSAIVSPDNATNKNVEWSSNNTSVATVSDTGEVKAISTGTATITCVAMGGSCYASCVVTVAEYLVDQFTGVKEFSYADDGEKALSKNFKVKEFRCHDGSDKILIDRELVRCLQQIRDGAGASITINSGYRTESHNASVGGASGSKHTEGKAADIVCSGKSPLELAQIAETLGMMGIEWNDDLNYTHVDTRAEEWHVKRCDEKYIPVSSFYDETE